MVGNVGGRIRMGTPTGVPAWGGDQHRKDQMVQSELSYTSSRQWITWVALSLFAGVTAATAVRVVREHQTPGPFDSARQGFCDFHNGVYFPSLAFRHGLSPYSQTYAENYPVERSVPFFSPVILAAHVPFSWLELHAAEIVYFVWMLLLVGAIAACVTHWYRESQEGSHWRWDLFACIALGLVATRSGQQTLFTGYFTFELIFASLLAVHYGQSRPLLSALALVLVSAKPNYVLPIALLMLCRGNFKAVILGGIVSATLAAGAFAWIMPVGGVSELLEQIKQTQEIHRSDPIERPVNNWIRIDALAIIAKWTATDPNELLTLAVMLVMLLPAGVLLWLHHHPKQGPAPTGSTLEPSGAVVLLTSVVSVYHHVYDGLLMVAPGTALLLGTADWKQLVRPARWLLAGALLFPAVNYLSSQKLLNALQIEGQVFQVITSVNAWVLLAGWLMMLGVLRQRVADRS